MPNSSPAPLTSFDLSASDTDVFAFNSNDGFPNGRRIGDDVTDSISIDLTGVFPFSDPATVFNETRSADDGSTLKTIDLSIEALRSKIDPIDFDLDLTIGIGAEALSIPPLSQIGFEDNSSTIAELVEDLLPSPIQQPTTDFGICDGDCIL